MFRPLPQRTPSPQLHQPLLLFRTGIIKLPLLDLEAFLRPLFILLNPDFMKRLAQISRHTIISRALFRRHGVRPSHDLGFASLILLLPLQALLAALRHGARVAGDLGDVVVVEFVAEFVVSRASAGSFLQADAGRHGGFLWWSFRGLPGLPALGGWRAEILGFDGGFGLEADAAAGFFCFRGLAHVVCRFLNVDSGYSLAGFLAQPLTEGGGFLEDGGIFFGRVVDLSVLVPVILNALALALLGVALDVGLPVQPAEQVIREEGDCIWVIAGEQERGGGRSYSLEFAERRDGFTGIRVVGHKREGGCGRLADFFDRIGCDEFGETGTIGTEFPTSCGTV